MSILEAAESMYPARVATESRAPYRRGDRICATSPEGTRYLVRVESITPTASGDFSIIGAVTAPRKYRSHVLSTVVGADGFGPAVRPAY
jgi:hypothetical protein